MPNPKPLKVFLCHAKLDAPAAHELYNFLNDRGAAPWLDSQSLIGGQYWKQEISEAINSSDAIIICLSRNSFNKQGFIQTEIKFALEKAKEVPKGNIFIIPVKLEECDVPFELNDYQWVDLFDAGGHEKVLRSLQMRARQLAGITVPADRPVSKVRKEAEHPRKTESPTPRPIQKPKEKFAKQESKSKWNRVYLFPLLFVVVILVIWGVSSLFKKTPIVPIANNPVGAQATAITDSDDGMTLIHVPSGSFVMGDNGIADTSPAHTVTLSAFRIDQHEVTNAQYLRCVTAGACVPPLSSKSNTRLNYYNNSDYKDFPVLNISWNEAKAYCEWAGRRLPTEAEWEKAARGTNALTYPWGENAPSDELLNFNNQSGDTVKVATKFGISPFKAFDMAGNVAEWVNDWYGEAYYQNSPSSNPTGPTSGDLRVARGGSWKSNASGVRTFVRDKFSSETRDVTLGFRCAVDEK